MNVWSFVAEMAAWAAGIFMGVAGLIIVLEYLEIKLASHFQHRVGFYHTGWHGILQPIADMVKLLAKGYLVPEKADWWIYQIAPLTAMIPAFMAFLVIPFSSQWVALDWNLGLLYLLAIPSIAIFGPLMAGYGSNNKYAMMGAVRSALQLLSYELPRVLSLLSVVMVAGSLSLKEVVEAQNVPFIILLPLGFVVFLISSLIEMNRIPFDVGEAESELVTGFHTEYGGIRWGLFMMGEYTHFIASAFLTSLLFLGGYRWPFLPGWLWLLLEVSLLGFLYFWFRWTYPRYRPDQMMEFSWKVLLPLALINFVWALFLVRSVL